MKKSLRGIVPPLITPLLNNDSLDIDGLERLIEHVIAGGVHGIFILGTTGEGTGLSFNLKVEMIKQTSRILNKRIPLLVGISDPSMIESVRLSRIAYESGADALVSAPPYYFPMAQPELIDFYENLVPQLELPLYLYNMPSHTKISFAPSTVSRLAQMENVIGFKDSSANGVYFQSVMHELKARKDFAIFVGPEEMLAEVVLMGANGGVAGGANMFPKLYVDLFEAASTGKVDEAKRLHSKVMQISLTIYKAGNYGSSFLKGVKCSLSILGICNDFLAAPFTSFDAEHRKIIAKAIDELELVNIRG